jgi:crotonobetainyl-CoA:carnitine CoA-transferase CaiB-like acyl-CoA transferase
MDRPFIGPAPALGEHTRDIAVSLLGLSAERTEELIQAGVLEVTPPAVGAAASASF